MDSTYYCIVPEQALITNATQRFGIICTFVRDNTNDHASHCSKSWLQANDVHVLQSPVESSNLNTIEILWVAIARKM